MCSLCCWSLCLCGTDIQAVQLGPGGTPGCVCHQLSSGSLGAHQAGACLRGSRMDPPIRSQLPSGALPS